jgi:hypothetical protein
MQKVVGSSPISRLKCLQIDDCLIFWLIERRTDGYAEGPGFERRRGPRRKSLHIGDVVALVVCPPSRPRGIACAGCRLVARTAWPQSRVKAAREAQCVAVRALRDPPRERRGRGALEVFDVDIDVEHEARLDSDAETRSWTDSSAVRTGTPRCATRSRPPPWPCATPVKEQRLTGPRRSLGSSHDRASLVAARAALSIGVDDGRTSIARPIRAATPARPGGSRRRSRRPPIRYWPPRGSLTSASVSSRVILGTVTSHPEMRTDREV